MKSLFLRAGTVRDSLLLLNLRIPRQYFDQETGLLYNYFGHYDPKVARYAN